MSTQVFSKTGNKSSTKISLKKEIFGLDKIDNNILKQAYLAYLANGRVNLAKSKSRGEIRGGGKKPHPQKGTGRARSGSIRNPIWRGGGITFGPTGIENYSRKINVKTKRLAIKQALSLVTKSDKLKIVDTFDSKNSLVKQTVNFINKIGAKGKILLILDEIDEITSRATRNIRNLKVIKANYLNVYDLLNSDNIIITKQSIEVIEKWLKSSTKIKSEKNV